MLILTVLQGPDKGKRFELPDTEPQQIGRSSESLPLTDTTISRRHAELTPDDGKWFINDLDSSNGTYVNGIRIGGPTLLKQGDQIRTGSTLFTFGRTSQSRSKPVRVVGSDQIASNVESAIPSADDSVIMAMPDPSENLQVLYELMQLVGSVFDRQMLLERVMALVFEHFEPDRGFILIRDSPDGKLEPVVVKRRDAKQEESTQWKITVPRTIVQHVLTKLEGVLSSNAMADKRFGPSDSVRAIGIRSAICVPIKIRDRVFGVIYIDSQVANYTFSDDQLRLMTAVGVQTGLALENAELYQQGVKTERLAAVGETVASLSHSIKNILQALRGGGEVVELGLRKQDLKLVKNGWAILARNLDRIYELTMNMLAYSKQRQPEIELVQLPRIIKEVIELYQPQCDRRNVALITEIDNAMPPIPVDTSGFHQAMTNLLSNALDAVEPGSGVITVRCEFDEVKDAAVVRVSDNGAGIEQDDLKRLFTPFFSTKGLRGTGLGLVVTKRIVTEHGGNIRVGSEPGKGTTITLTWPATLSADPGKTQHA